jgi:hypothetical protein
MLEYRQELRRASAKRWNHREERRENRSYLEAHDCFRKSGIAELRTRRANPGLNMDIISHYLDGVAVDAIVWSDYNGTDGLVNLP